MIFFQHVTQIRLLGSKLIFKIHHRRIGFLYFRATFIFPLVPAFLALRIQNHDYSTDLAQLIRREHQIPAEFFRRFLKIPFHREAFL